MQLTSASSLPRSRPLRRTAGLIFAAALVSAGLSDVGAQEAADDDFKREMSLAIEAMDSGKLEAAAQHFTAAGSLVAETAMEAGHAWLGLAEMRFRQEQYEESLEAARKAFIAAPELSAAAFAVGRGLAAVGRTSEALELLEMAQELDPANETAGSLHALLLRGDQELEETTESKQLVEALEEAMDLANSKRIDEAYTLLRQLEEEHPEDGRVQAQLAQVFFYRRQPQDAQIAIEKARSVLPEQAYYHYLAGLFHLDANRPAKAEEAFRRSLLLDPELGDAEALLGGALNKLGREEEAIEHFQRALDLGKDVVEVRLGYAGALESLGRDEEAAEQMEAYRRLSEERAP